MTRREEIFEILKKEKMSAQVIANLFKVELTEILDDLQHLARSVRPAFELRMIPAYCKKCEFVFRERNKVKAPTKCPRCRSEWIQAPLFFIERKK
jgi:predicted Zn-ribbon and HTH transcriptional regulator